MKKSNITRTKELDLCISCEICLATCPVRAITMEYKKGQFFPKVYEERCKSCGLCLEICPGIDIDPFGLRNRNISESLLDGYYLEGYTAYSNNLKIRENSSSGGLITALIIELIKNKEFDSAFVLDFDKYDNKPARLRPASKVKEILNSAKSKYIPASVYNVIKNLKESDIKKYIIVGTPCQIYGIKKFIKKFNISDENLLFLGLFCEKTLNFNIIQYFEDTYKQLNEKLIKLDFRTKEKFGWPGNLKIYFNSGREIIVDRSVRMRLKKFFQLNRCLFCADKLNRQSDISFGDCYIKEKNDFYGKSNVIVRNKKGQKILDRYSYLFRTEKESMELIRKTQHLNDKKNNLEYAKIFIKKHNIYPDVAKGCECDGKLLRKLTQFEKYIKWGKNYNYFKIRHAMFLLEVKEKLMRIYYLARKVISIGIIMCQSFLIHIFIQKRKPSAGERSGSIVMVGGQLFNKGCQAMVFTTVDQMKRRFPHKNIYLFSTQDFDRKDEEKSIYKFIILPWDFATKIRLLCSWNKLFKKGSRYSYLENDIERIIKEASFIIDISGYALSSQWSSITSLNYILNIVIAKKYSVPYYIFPQSIGPFNYPLMHRVVLYPLLKMFLRYPKKILPREKEGLEWVRKFTKANTERDYDLVLRNVKYNLDNIYNKQAHFKNIKIWPQSVGIIPNVRVFARISPAKLYLLYGTLINKLLSSSKKVYIIRHSYGDLELCEKIKDQFSDNVDVKLISDDLNAIELEYLMGQFCFVIASRYHSVIHSYRNGTPALVIGWATKYLELLQIFNQSEYNFDVRDNMEIDEVNRKLDRLMLNYKNEREEIVHRLNSLKNKNFIDALFGPIKR